MNCTITKLRCGLHEGGFSRQTSHPDTKKGDNREKKINVKKKMLLSKRHSDIHALAEIEGQLGKKEPLQQREATNSSQLYRTGASFFALFHRKDFFGSWHSLLKPFLSFQMLLNLRSRAKKGGEVKLKRRWSQRRRQSKRSVAAF